MNPDRIDQESESEMTSVGIAVLLRVLSNPSSNVFQKRLSEKGQSPLWMNGVTFCLLSLFCLFPAAKIDWTTFSTEFWAFALVAGLICAVGNACLVKALQLGELSVLGPINAWKSIVGLLFAFVLLGEIPSAFGFVGIGLIVCGSYFVLGATSGGFSFRTLIFNRGIRLRLVAMILAAVEAVFLKKIVLLSNPAVSFYLWSGFGAIFSFFLLPIQKIDVREQIRRLNVGDVREYALLALCVGTMQYSTNFVFQRLDVGYSLALFQLSAVVGVFFGRRFFHERRVFPKLIGSLVMIAGSTVIILLD